MSETILELHGIYKGFDGTPVLKGIGLQVERGEFITLLGSSGCGKTTTLRIIAGLEAPDQGRVLLEGKDMTDVEPNKRDVNTVFQSYALFPHMNVEQNVGYALKLRKRPKGEIKEEVKKMLELVQLSGFEKRKPAELSGGQKQRVAIARSLINRPKILLLDEPLGALDLQLRRQMQQELKRLQKKLGMAIIMVTHDLGVIASMCDEIIVMYGGRVCERGTADDIFYAPAHEYTKGLLRSIPTVENNKERLVPIGGTPINLLNMPKGCAFCTRCDSAMKICLEEVPEELRVSDTHLASCWLNVKRMMEAEKGGEVRE